eukprot:355679-Chlamydomonas_euryale.AAC.1
MLHPRRGNVYKHATGRLAARSGASMSHTSHAWQPALEASCHTLHTLCRLTHTHMHSHVAHVAARWAACCHFYPSAEQITCLHTNAREPYSGPDPQNRAECSKNTTGLSTLAACGMPII